MRFNLRRPCAECPFRSDIDGYLRPERAREIFTAITSGDGSFSCHKTNDYDDDSEPVETAASEHCAGALILLERLEQPNQAMRIAERLGLYDRRKIDMDAPVYEDGEAFVRGHRG